jgi:hypothetical protein
VARESAGRFRKWWELISENMRDSAMKTANKRRIDAMAAIKKATSSFAEEHATYHAGVLDNLLDTPAFASNLLAYYAACRDMPRDAKRKLTSAREAVGRVIDDELGRLCDAGDEFLEALIKTPEKIEIQITTPPKRREVDLFWFVYDPLFPAEIASAMVDRLRSEAAWLLMKFARNWSTDDIREIARERVTCLRNYARYVAGIPGNNLELIPPAERLDVAALLERARIGQEHINAIAPQIIKELQK